MTDHKGLLKGPSSLKCIPNTLIFPSSLYKSPFAIDLLKRRGVKFNRSHKQKFREEWDHNTPRWQLPWLCSRPVTIWCIGTPEIKQRKRGWMIAEPVIAAFPSLFRHSSVVIIVIVREHLCPLSQGSICMKQIWYRFFFVCMFFGCSTHRLLKLGDVAILLLQMTVHSALWSTS